MKAARLVERRRPLELADLPDPAPGAGEAVVEVEAEGICRTDWHVWNGDWDWVGLVPTLPLVMGHELGGTVVAVGAGVSRVRPGDRVTTPFHESCGRCGYCMIGRSNLCDDMQFLGLTHDGGYARYAAIRNADFNCIQLPDSIDALSAAAIGCRYMTAFHAVTRQGRLAAGYGFRIFTAMRYVLDGAFGAAELSPLPWLRAQLEYDSEKWNAGLGLNPWAGLRLRAALLHFESLSLGAGWSLTL